MSGLNSDVKGNRMEKIHQLLTDETGIQHAEEALLLSLIAVVAVAAVTSVGTKVLGTFNTAANSIK